MILELEVSILVVVVVVCCKEERKACEDILVQSTHRERPVVREMTSEQGRCTFPLLCFQGKHAC
jgi:hypothetical protein